MSRYIDADKIEYTARYVGMGEFAGFQTVAYKSEIDEIPTADVVEVVRCKDCKHWVKGGYDPIISRDFGSCTCEYWEHPSEYYETSGNDYCSHGERKD